MPCTTKIEYSLDDVSNLYIAGHKTNEVNWKNETTIMISLKFAWKHLWLIWSLHENTFDELTLQSVKIANQMITAR